MNGPELRKQSLKTGELLVVASGPWTPARGAPLTDCSQTVPTQPDAIEHICGKHLGQAHIWVHAWMRRDGLVGVESRHPAHDGVISGGLS
jgi:hypothetical protein